MIISVMPDRGDNWVIEMTYTDSKGKRTRRVVSPIRVDTGKRFLAICLCRAQPQSFVFARCTDVRRVPAADYVMPTPIIELESVTDKATFLFPGGSAKS